MPWKIIFIAMTCILVYFSYGVAQGGGPLAFFVGCVAGSIITYLFTRAKQEAAAAHFEAKQKVQVNLNQQRTNISQPLTPEQIANIVERVVDNKLLLVESKQTAISQGERRELLSRNLWDLAANDDDRR